MIHGEVTVELSERLGVKDRLCVSDMIKMEATHHINSIY